MTFGKAGRRRRSEGVVLSMSTMIDVTFLLLAYFVVTTAANRPEDRLSPTLQGDRPAEAGPANDFQPQVVEVVILDGAPAFLLGSRTIRDRGELVEALRQLPKENGLFVRVADGPRVADAALALQAGHDAGFQQVTYVPLR